MYFITNNNIKGKLIDLGSLSNLKFFAMGSSRKVFKINESDIKNINVCNKKLAYPLVSKKVNKEYEKLIKKLTEILIDSDDETGDVYMEALNQIERFRQLIKNKYREFLKQKDIEMMSKQLTLLKKEAEKRLIDLQDTYIDKIDNNKSR